MLLRNFFLHPCIKLAISNIHPCNVISLSIFITSTILSRHSCTQRNYINKISVI
ncbi:hypothetical protein GLYMA_17G210200v4 [Glycine max]|uniref:Uncharacterized protein n=1 Tax=Glycine max TaxID=3847 RepID=K7MN18_SOYBN|nr:hypothetical protein JHK85_048865 [Glycine max]KAG5103297.1 hypothetical protein JHK84_048266 [Glycine max]KAH1119397.1 hypothetical protein GYH30_047977 [Glycine max]KRH05153.1 hypothetical protein GLYMA_17G210200v4 [Glycine max]